MWLRSSQTRGYFSVTIPVVSRSARSSLSLPSIVVRINIENAEPMTVNHRIRFFVPTRPVLFDFYFGSMRESRLVTGTARLSDDALELVNLLLGTAEGTELRGRVSTIVVVSIWWVEASYSLLGELTGALVLRVTQQLDDTLLVGSEAKYSEKELVSSYFSREKKEQSLKHLSVCSAEPGETDNVLVEVEGGLTQQPPSRCPERKQCACSGGPWCGRHGA